MSEIRAIETVYKGYRFRSRLEARWAVFFDALGIEYDYEPQGFELGEGMRYLPDFWLDQYDMWVEIKPDEPNPREARLAKLMAEKSYQNVLVISGRPASPQLDETGFFVQEPAPYTATLFYGTFARVVDIYIHHRFERLVEFLRENGYEVEPYDGGARSARALIEVDKQYYRDRYGKEHPDWVNGPTADKLLWGAQSHKAMATLTGLWDTNAIFSPQMEYAYRLANTARFEHGETPSVVPWGEYSKDIPF